LALDRKANIQALLEGSKNNQDKSRSPMQWNGRYIRGIFKETLVKINSDYKINVQNGKEQHSVLNKYIRVDSLKK
jgi:hypothetical protein